MVEFVDGSTLVQASPPTMLIPIALGLAWPDRVPGRRRRRSTGRRPETGGSSRSTTRRSRPSRWPGRPASAGGTAPAVYNAANEVCVDAFRDGRLRFVDIVPTVASVLAAHDVPSEEQLTVDDVLAADALGPRRRPSTRIEGPRMTALYYTLGVLIFVVAILASIGLHEFGHMIPAKKFGGKVTQ